MGVSGTALNVLLLACQVNMTTCYATLWGGQGHDRFQKKSETKPQVPTER